MTNIRKQNPSIKKAAVIGWPVSHSLSPHIHAFWRQEQKIAGHYFRIPCPATKEAFDKCLEIMAAQNYVGANITLPHKLHALAASDSASENAMQIGAANMISFNRTNVAADNSDLYGFATALEGLLSRDDERARALVIGAGGAAPAVCLALQAAGYQQIDLTNRTPEKAEQVLRYLSLEGKVLGWEEKQASIWKYDLIVNTTSLGMAGQGALEIDVSVCNPQTIIADIVYDPQETDLLKQAREMGLRYMNGLSMLMHQAVPGFEKWFGVRPKVTGELERHLYNVLKSRRHGPIKIGLTGSIGMGKSTVGDFLKEENIPVWDADAAVHRLYAKGGGAAKVLKPHFSGIIEDGGVLRERLAAHLQTTPEDFPLLEKLIHPLVGADRQVFLEEATKRGDRAVLLDIPLLFETGQQHEYDAVMVVSAAENVRKKRVLARPNMSEDKFKAITARQMPEMEKMMLADYLVYTDRSLSEAADEARQALAEILEKYKRM